MNFAFINKSNKYLHFNDKIQLPLFFFFRTVVLLSLTSVLFFNVSTLRAGRLKCDSCGKIIIGKYIKDRQGRVFCSKKCYLKSLPKCCICGKPAKIHSGGKYYCSKKCLKSTWRICAACGKRINKGVVRGGDKIFLCSECAAKPKCFACSMPGDYELNDGRFICKECYKTAVFEEEKAIEIAEKIRRIMREDLLLSTDHKINYHLVSLFELKKRISNKVTELGLFKFSMVIKKTTKTRTHGSESKKSVSRKITSENYDIYFLSGLPLKKLQEVAAHELAHDWMQEQFPNIKDVVIREGWAEYVASEVNKILGHSDMNSRMEKNSDPTYGKGYRYIKKYIDENGINALLESFKEQK